MVYMYNESVEEEDKEEEEEEDKRCQQPSVPCPPLAPPEKARHPFSFLDISRRERGKEEEGKEFPRQGDGESVMP